MPRVGTKRAVAVTVRRGGKVEQHELALDAPSDADGALDRMVEILGVDGQQSESVTTALALPHLVALIVAADAVQSTALRGRLARSTVDRPVLTPELLERELERALRYEDERWAGASSRVVAPEPFTAARGRMLEGLAALEHAGLATPVPRGYALTPAGAAFTTAFNEATSTASLVESTVSGSSNGPAAWALVHAGPEALCMSAWDAGAHVELSRCGAADLRARLRAFVSREVAATVTRRCTNPSCGKAVPESKKFCTSCGTPYSAPPESPPVPPERRCPNPRCGKPAPADKRFCTACATPLP